MDLRRPFDFHAENSSNESPLVPHLHRLRLPERRQNSYPPGKVTDTCFLPEWTSLAGDSDGMGKVTYTVDFDHKPNSRIEATVLATGAMVEIPMYRMAQLHHTLLRIRDTRLRRSYARFYRWRGTFHWPSKSGLRRGARVLPRSASERGDAKWTVHKRRNSATSLDSVRTDNAV